MLFLDAVLTPRDILFLVRLVDSQKAIYFSYAGTSCANRPTILPRSHIPCLSQMASHRRLGRDVGLFGRVPAYAIVVTKSPHSTDPFPVGLAFFGQLSFLGRSTSLAYIRPVRRTPSHFTRAISPTSPPRTPFLDI